MRKFSFDRNIKCHFIKSTCNCLNHPFLFTVHGQWGAWGIVEECRKPCSSTRNSIKRRFCDNPKPTYGGDYCVGDGTRSYPCPTEPCKCECYFW